MRRKFVPTKKYGRWTIVSPATRSASNALRWVCVCDCGTEKIVHQNTMLNGTSKSCGCLSIEIFIAQNKARNTTHGQTRGGYTAEYRAWLHLRNRCYNENVPDFHNYGGRGITVCERWRNSYEAFFADMGRRPSSKHTIDRIDTNGNYEPSNCRWATQITQQNNKRSNFIVSFSGREMTLKEACREVGLNYQFIWLRIQRYGYTLQEAVSTPKRGSYDAQPLSRKFTNRELYNMFAGSDAIGVARAA